jgi:DNA-binding transcriptional LysR family regulator
MTTEPLPHLETFAEAAERGSFTAAGRMLGLTQAAVSQRIHQLEATLRTTLFRRAAGGVTLTAAGRRLHKYARRILDLIAEARSAVTGASDVVESELALAASSVPGQYLLPPILAAFRERHSHIRVRMTVSDTDAVLRQIRLGEAHLGITGGQGNVPDLEFRPLAEDELALVLPAHHSWRRKRRIKIRDLLTVPLVQREEGSGTRHCMERALERLGVAPSRLTVALELGSTEAVKGAVLGGAGAAIMSRRAIEREVRSGQLRALAVEGLGLDREIYVVRHKGRALPGSAELFLAFLNPLPEAGSVAYRPS